MNLSGTFTALITPFIGSQIDQKGLSANVEWQIANGVSGLVALGTTGEAPTLTDAEFDEVVSVTVKQARGRVPVVVGTADCSTRRAIQKTARAQELGADLALVVMPWFNRPTQEGLYRHISAIAEAVSLPLLVYNMPSRTGVNLQPETLWRMAQLPSVAGMKEEVHQAAEVLRLTRTRKQPFALFSGDDISALQIMALGGHGVVSVLSNLIPDEIVALTTAMQQGRYEEARTLHYRLLPLFHAAFLESNPIPIKEAMAQCGLPAGGCRLPLCEMRPENRTRLYQVLQELNIVDHCLTGRRT